MITDIGERIAVLRVRLQGICTGYDHVALEQTGVRGGMYRVVGVGHGRGVAGQDSRSCIGWIDPATGDIYKPAGWARPYPKVRASVLDDDFGTSVFGKYGVIMVRDGAA